MSDLIIRRMNLLENMFDSYKILDEIKFDGSHDDKCSFVFYRYLHLRIDGHENETSIERIESVIQQYKDRENTKAANFYRNNQCDYFWIKTQITFYLDICDGKMKLNSNFVTGKQYLLDLIEGN